VIARLRELVGAVSFHRGLALGALVGSAIAGSTIWARIREARRSGASDDEGRPEARLAVSPEPRNGTRQAASSE
jgi:hypothetical protein